MPLSLVFDLDLTLLRTATRESWIAAMQQLGLDEDSAQQAYRSGIGQAGIVTAQHAFPRREEDQKRLLSLYEDLLGEAPVQAMPGAIELLPWLRQQGHILFISTGASPDKLERYLDQFGWRDLFSLAIGSSADCPKGLAHLERCAETMDRDLESFARNTLTIGDGAGEMTYGRVAGIRYRCAYMGPNPPESLPGLVQAGANLVISHLSELPELLAYEEPLNSRYAVQ